VSLTTGRGPLSKKPAGRFSAPVPEALVYVEPFPRRVRGRIGDRWVIDSERALLVHRQGLPPSFAFPACDVDDSVGSTDEPEAPGHVRVAWDAVEQWFEEEEQVLGHPRNPYHRVDCVRTSRRLKVELGGVAVVDTATTMGVYETSLAPRLYVSRELVRTDLLARSRTTSYCPYKGWATWWDVVVGDLRVSDAAWSYDDPLPECEPIRAMLSFYTTGLVVTAELPPAG
jgi:uncharacterized protein (DUF427 family)